MHSGNRFAGALAATKNCHNLFGWLQMNTLIDMEQCIESVDGTIEINNGRLTWYAHDYYLRNTAFDTYQKMSRIGGKSCTLQTVPNQVDFVQQEHNAIVTV